MKTPEEKYLNDPAYNRLVQSLEALIKRADFTPSEIREAAMYACIRHEMWTMRRFMTDTEAPQDKKEGR